MIISIAYQLSTFLEFVTHFGTSSSKYVISTHQRNIYNFLNYFSLSVLHIRKELSRGNMALNYRTLHASLFNLKIHSHVNLVSSPIDDITVSLEQVSRYSLNYTLNYRTINAIRDTSHACIMSTGSRLNLSACGEVL